MTSYFHIDFDSTAPEITWGTISGVGRGRILTAYYTVTEPGVTAAEFIDSNGAITDLEVLSDRIRGQIPDDAAYGQGAIRAWLQDDVGNTAVRSTYVTIAGPAFSIRLDTTPPVISWGTPTGTTAGELLRIPYTINEPSLLSASVRDSGNNDYPMTVYPDRLEVLLPPDVVDGFALVSANVEDDVGNSATRTLGIVLGGVVVVPVPGLVPQMPFRTRRFPPRIIRDRSSAKVSSLFSLLVTTVRSSRARVSASYDSESTVRGQVHTIFSHVRVNDRWVVLGRQSSVTAMKTRSTEVAIKRVDGVEYEDELLLLTL